MLQTQILSAPILAVTLLLFGPTCAAHAQLPGRCELPVSQRTSDIGCWVAANEELGTLSRKTVFWHLYSFPNRAAAETMKTAHGTVLDSFGKTWLFTIAESEWRPEKGERVAVVGPLHVQVRKSYTARYLEARIPPGQHTPIHTHAGPEAWYVMSGAQCLETPEGITVVRAGESAVVREGPPMMLSSTGAETRQSLVRVLHDSAKPWTMLASGWEPKGACPK